MQRGLSQALSHRDWPRVTLYVLDEADWHARLKLPYGYPAARVRGTLAVYAPARVPDRLVMRFLEVLTGAKVQPPGPASEFFDLVTGHEYGHALAVGTGLRARVRELDEALANLLWALGLRRGQPEAFARLTLWAGVLARLPKPPAKPRTLGQQLAFQGRILMGAIEHLGAHEPTWLKDLVADPPPPEQLKSILGSLNLSVWPRSSSPENSPEAR